MFDKLNIIDKLSNQLNTEIEELENEDALKVDKQHILKVLQILKEEFNFKRLADITSVDFIHCFEVVYHLLNENGEVLCIKVRIDKKDNLMPSSASLWKAADVQEREVYDMMGILFEGHKNLKRILCKEDFEGHALLKDFKLKPVSRF